MTSYTELLARLGLVPKEMAAEFTRWGYPQPEAKEASDTTTEEAVTSIRERIESEEAVDIRQTDLDVLHQYMNSGRSGRLHLCIRSLSGEINTGDINIRFGRNPQGEYIIPWNHESIEEYMTDPDTYLQDGRRRIRFKATRELWFGESKAFMVATPEDTNGTEG